MSKTRHGTYVETGFLVKSPPMIQEKLQEILARALKIKKEEVALEHPADKSHGDFTTVIALKHAKEKNENPRKLAMEIVNKIGESDSLESIEVAGPGFINFKLSKKALIDIIKSALDEGEKFGGSTALKGQKIMVEFAHPNTHKAFHIGHLRNISLGESLVRLLESQGAKIFRANYQGDIGLHVAKCLWGYMQENPKSEPETPQDKAEFLGKVYAIGGKAFEKDAKAKEEIYVLNKKIYEHSSDIAPLWEKTRKWSLEYFDYIYKRLGSKFDRLFFESEVCELGKKLVLENIKKKIFEESQGAVIFPGEKYGLHNRVFITGEGNPTYEAKEMGLAKLEQEAFEFSKNIHVVANEQESYFKVVFKAMDMLYPGLLARQKHLSYGMVTLTTGKMSSRTGDVITAEFLIKEARDKVAEIVASSGLSDAEKEEITEKVAIGGIKFTMLFSGAKNDIAFDLEKAVRLEGDSGPYIQYAYARICSILEKVKTDSEVNFESFNEDDWNLARCVAKFHHSIGKSAEEYSPHHLAHYLLELAGEFSKWYGKNTVKDAQNGLRSARIELLKAVKQTIGNGLYLLGMGVVERM
ncbi:TPA: arginine--tRNA ligase [Candidatus Peregrinibacteria bacterium]|nr:MAG: Arginine-tRNA ligase [Candidatus Peregrinibacteria bacterium GW2011_GWA2_43_8]HAU39985.1 arginine--tRNA ligase [Candidatus Peregrinibacteria bacterium]